MTQVVRSRGSLVSRRPAIIERPRLIRKLDACEAQTILLLAPAGYGKTTLARQWAATLTGVVWVSLTSAHRDVAVLARDLAHQIEALGDEGFTDFVDQYLRARDNPQAAGRELANVIATAAERAKARWLVLDDYHELAGVDGAEEFVEALKARANIRFLVSSRRRPAWAGGRPLLYGEVDELGQRDLAMNATESAVLVGRRGPELRGLLDKAEGWPAVVALAARVNVTAIPSSSLLPETLHRFLAEELFASIAPALQEKLTRLALQPPAAVALESSESDDPDIGFALGGDGALHPLMREFLLTKLASSQYAERKIIAAVETCLVGGQWEYAFELILRFQVRELVAPAIEVAYKPLVKNGRVWTLAQFATALKTQHMEVPGLVDLIDAETALCDGAYDLASTLASRALRLLSSHHPLTASAALVLGDAAVIRADAEAAESAYRLARDASIDDHELGEALLGLFRTTVFAERPESREHLNALEQRRDRSPTDLVRYGVAVALVSRFGFDIKPITPIGSLTDECLLALQQIQDPNRVTSFLNTSGNSYRLNADYALALKMCDLMQEQVDAFDLEFVRPFAEWLRAAAYLGLRRFGESEHALQRVEAALAGRQVTFHDSNIRVLRARLLIQTGRAGEALDLLDHEPPDVLQPAMRAEYCATRALVLAVLGETEACLASAAKAEAMSIGAEPRAYSVAARAILMSTADDPRFLESLLDHASSLDTWDPVISALRSSASLVAQAASVTGRRRALLRQLCERATDRALARQLGLKIKAASTQSLLSPRELEVLGLVTQGMRNGEIARALFISESTVKVHVRHIFEKLGVRTRSEAAARFNS